jgi:hypothetical protein
MRATYLYCGNAFSIRTDNGKIIASNLEVWMDDINEKLFAQLGGTGSAVAEAPAEQPEEAPSPPVPNQDEGLDCWRILVVELAYLLNASFRDAHYWEGVEAEKDTFSQFVRILRELSQMPQGMLDDVVVDDNQIRYWSDQGEHSVENVDQRLL